MYSGIRMEINMKKSIKIAIFALFGISIAHGMDNPKQLLSTAKNPELALFESLKDENLEKVKVCFEAVNRPVDRPFEDPAIPEETRAAKITPLMMACFFGNTPIVNYLISHKKANPLIASADGKNALSFCLLGDHTNHLPIFRLVLEQKLNNSHNNQLLSRVDEHGFTPLERAICIGNTELVEYLLSRKDVSFDPIMSGTTAMSLAHTKKRPEIVALLTSRGTPPVAENSPTILSSIFYSPQANKHINLEFFEPIAYTAKAIPTSHFINGFENGATIQIIQPRVFEQGRKKEDKECIKAKLKFAAEKLGGTPKMHEETSPIFGGTCSYHAMKNALIGLLLLEDYDILAKAAEDSQATTTKSDYVVSDTFNLTAIKSPHFDFEKFAEALHSKIFALNNTTAPFMQQEAIAIQQGSRNDSMLIAREIFDHEFNKELSKRHGLRINNSASKISFIDEQTLRSLITNFRLPYQTNAFDLQKDQDLVSQIALFRKSKNYRHAFHISLNTGELSGYGQSCGTNRMHAIAVVLDKKGPQVNVLVFESNNTAPYAIKQILFDFIALFTDETKKIMDTGECEMQAALAQDPLCISKSNASKSVCNIQSLLENYPHIEAKCHASKKREDITEAMLCLSHIKHAFNILENLDSVTIQEKLEGLFKKHKINAAWLRAKEISLHQLLEEIQTKELQERLRTFIMQKDLTRTKNAIDAGANPNYIDSDGNTNLILGIYHGIGVVKLLVENNTAVNKPDRKGVTPLMVACEQGDKEIIEYLISHEADINCQDEQGNTPLFYLAASTKDEQIRAHLVQELIEKHNARIDLRNKAGQDVITAHAICGSSKAFQYLVKKQNKHIDLPDLINYLCEQKLSLGTGPFGPHFSPVPFCQYISKTYDLNNRSNQNALFKLVCSSFSKGRADILQTLVDKKCLPDINTQDEQGWTLLMHAAFQDYPELIQKIIREFHADINKKNNCEQSAFDICVENLKLRSLDYFIKNHGYSINLPDCYGSNALHYAATKCKFLTIQSLIEFYKADINTRDAHGRTALMILSGAHTPGIQCAASECNPGQNNGSDNEDYGMMMPFSRRRPRGHLEAVRFLVENGCDVRNKDAQGLTALDYAKKAGRQNIVDYLTDHTNTLPQEPLEKVL